MAANFGWTPRRVLRLIELKREGATAPAIAREFGISDRTVRVKWAQVRSAFEARGERIYMVEGRFTRDLRNADPATAVKRRCLCGCGRLFASTHAGERISPACREGWSKRG